MYSVSDGLRSLALILTLAALPGHATVAANTSLTQMSDNELSGITGQNGSLFISDHIRPNELAGAPTDGTANFDFYRMGMDVRLNMNLNIAKFQLGCGGVNDLLTTSPACDMDIDYLSFMGINSAGTFPSPDGPDSAFELIRPYVELAIKNDSSPTLREVVGFKIGGQRINGALSIGRDYLGVATLGPESSGNIPNQEGYGDPRSGGSYQCRPGATTGPGSANCHSGINSISGFLSLEMSAAVRAVANVAVVGSTNIDVCFGRFTVTPAPMSTCNSSTQPFFVEAGGTRIQRLHVAAAKLEVHSTSGFGGWLLQAITDSGHGQLILDMRSVHYLLTPNTENFFLSLQREPVRWPNYSKAPPPNNIPNDICNPSYGQTTTRCNSAYAAIANTGWWLNAPGAKVLNVNPTTRIDVGDMGIGDALSLLGPEGRLIVDSPKLDLRRIGNCHGNALFC